MAWRQGWDVKHDSPFAGSFVPGKHFRRSPNVWSVMVEVRRDLYINEETGDKIEAFDSVRLGVHDVCKSLIECAREYAQYLKR